MQINYNLEKGFLKKVEDEKDETNRREVATEEQLKKILKRYPNAPADFIAYLKEIGSGNFRECQFKVQPFLFNLEALGLDKHYAIKSNIWFFGDNYCGDFSGFDLDRSDGLVVEFWHETGELYYTNQTFQRYIRQKMLMDEQGNDTQV